VRKTSGLLAILVPCWAHAAEIQIAVQNPVVELSVEQVVHADPDTARIGAGVTTRAATASEAMRQNAQAMERVVARIVALGIARKDIQTSNFSLSPQYQYTRDGEPPRFLGYDASNQVSINLRDLSRIGPTLDALVAAGATNLQGPHFALDRDEQARASARRGAFEQGQRQATELARIAGYGGVRLLEVSEGTTGYRVAVGAVRGKLAVQDVATPIELGQVGVTVHLTLKYEMTR
jgi:uncharacterized protein YggE